MYTPKKLKWNSLCEFRDFLLRETTEKIVFFDGWRLVTETSHYGIVDGLLRVDTADKKNKPTNEIVELGNKPKVPKKKKVVEVKPKSKKDILAEMRERGKKALDKKKSRKR